MVILIGCASNMKKLSRLPLPENMRGKPLRDRYNYAKRRARSRRRVIVLEHYSGGAALCACCGEKEEVFLTIDHMDNDGATHKKNNGLRGSVDLYRWIIQNDFPKNFQVLCMNCNWAKFKVGKCPHA